MPTYRCKKQAQEPSHPYASRFMQVWFMINFVPCFGKAHEWGTFPKCGARFDYCLILRMPPPEGFTLHVTWSNTLKKRELPELGQCSAMHRMGPPSNNVPWTLAYTYMFIVGGPLFQHAHKHLKSFTQRDYVIHINQFMSAFLIVFFFGERAIWKHLFGPQLQSRN